MADYYELLGVDRGATQDEIKKAYRKIARELHPDVNPDPEVQNKFKEVTAAYDQLSDPQKRQQYDMGGRGGFNANSNGFGGGGFGGGGFSDIMDAFFGGGGNRGPRPRMRQGQDALIRIEVDLHEACFGTERDITLESAVVCEKCEGQGTANNSAPEMCGVCKGRGEMQFVQKSFLGQVMTSRPCTNCSGYGSVIKDPCRECAGDGRVRAKQTINIKVPAGVETGNRIQMSGRGEVGAGGGPAGDLYVEIVEADHDFLLRDGDNLNIAISIPFAAATLGTTVTVETLDGPVDVQIKGGLTSGSTIPVKGKGMTRLRSTHRGDLIVHVDIETPHKLNKEQEKLLREFAKARGEKDGDVTIKRHEEGLFSKFRDTFHR
jgi:molecular chaperone DnaJ